MKKPSEFEGMTDADCCLDCQSDNCVVTNRPRCGHPRKGGLQGPEHHDTETVDRFNRARKHLAQVAAAKD